MRALLESHLVNPAFLQSKLRSTPFRCSTCRRQYQSIGEEVLASISCVGDSQIFVFGPEVEALEREIAALTGASAAVGVLLS